MDPKELTHDERLALVGLLKMVVWADKSVSEGEQKVLDSVASKVGTTEWAKAVHEATTSFRSRQAVVDFVAEITRQPARQWIFAALVSAAEADHVDPAEGKVLNWLAELRNIK